MYINLTIKALNRNQYTGLLNRRLILCTFIIFFFFYVPRTEIRH